MFSGSLGQRKVFTLVQFSGSLAKERFLPKFMDHIATTKKRFLPKYSFDGCLSQRKFFTRRFHSFCSSRLGRRYDNQKLYCNVLDEMARCGKLTGRAALLTGDMNNMMKVLIVPCIGSP